MSDINKGVLFLNEWFDALKDLNLKDHKMLVHAIYDAQILNIPPPEFKGKAKIAASIIFPYIERRKKQSEFGRAGANVRYSQAPNDANQAVGKTSPVGNNPNGYPNRYPNGYPNGYPNEQNKTKLNQINLNYNKKHAPAAKEQSSVDFDKFFEAAVRRSLGIADKEESA